MKKIFQTNSSREGSYFEMWNSVASIHWANSLCRPHAAVIVRSDERTNGSLDFISFRYHSKQVYYEWLTQRISFAVHYMIWLRSMVTVSRLPTNPAKGSRSQLNFALPPCRLLVAVVAAIIAVDWYAHVVRTVAALPKLVFKFLKDRL